MKTIEGNKEMGFNLSDGMAEEIQHIEDKIRKRICINSEVSTSKLVNEYEGVGNTNKAALERALDNLVRNGELIQTKGGKTLRRVC